MITLCSNVHFLPVHVQSNAGARTCACALAAEVTAAVSYSQPASLFARSRVSPPLDGGEGVNSATTKIRELRATLLPV